jgi:hypothetical protein
MILYYAMFFSTIKLLHFATKNYAASTKFSRENKKTKRLKYSQRKRPKRSLKAKCLLGTECWG